MQLRMGQIWPTSSEIIRMGLYERGDLLGVLEDRLRDLTWLMVESEAREFSPSFSLSYGELVSESVQIEDLVNLIKAVGWEYEGDPNA